MEQTTHLWLFFVMVFGIVLLPGLDMAFILASSLVGGRGAGLSAVAGIIAFAFWRITQGASTVGDFMGFVTAMLLAAPPPDPILEAGKINARLAMEYLKRDKLEVAQEKVEKALVQNPLSRWLLARARVRWLEVQRSGQFLREQLVAAPDGVIYSPLPALASLLAEKPKPLRSSSGTGGSTARSAFTWAGP